MISAQNVGSAGKALQYFAKDNYYTEKEGLEESAWFGKGAAKLGLEGKIDKEAFSELLKGHVDGHQLGKLVKNETGDAVDRDVARATILRQALDRDLARLLADSIDDWAKRTSGPSLPETTASLREHAKGEPDAGTRRDHRPGIDITFSAPKSVSIMAEVHGSADIRAAHEEAVKTALGYVERELSYTRQMKDGKLESIKTGNIVVGMFRHNTSRDLDPQTHTHAVVMNATKRLDGQWRSLSNEEIYNAQRTINAIYTSDLAARIQSLGYEIRNTDERGGFEIAGISREQIEHFSQRLAGIREALKERGLDMETATPAQRKMMVLATRAPKQDVNHADMHADWKRRAQEIGIDFGAIDNKAHGKTIGTVEIGGDDRQRFQSEMATARDVLAEWGTAHSKSVSAWAEPANHHTALADLLGAIEHTAGRDLNSDDLKQLRSTLEGVRDVMAEWQSMYSETISAPEFEQTAYSKWSGYWDAPDNHHMAMVGVLDALDRTTALQRQLDEKTIVATVPERISGRAALEFAAAHLIEREAVVSKHELIQVAVEHGSGRVPPRAIELAFAKLEKEGDLVRLPDGNYTTKKMLGSEMWALEQVRDTKGQAERIMGADTVTERLAGIEKQNRFRYTDGQKEAITKVLTSDDRFVAVQGLAGTGKTTMLKGVNTLAKENGYVVRGMAATGNASKTLSLETGIVTETVSMFQIKERQLEKDIAFAQKYAPDWKRQKELWIVDESSFLSQRQKAQLDHMANKAGAKVVYLGDTLQLQGVEAGKPFEMAQRHGIDTAYMTDIRRQNTPELKASIDILTGRDRAETPLTNIERTHSARAFDHMDNAGMVREIKDGTIPALVKDIVALDKAERERTMVITPYNKDRQEINQGVRAGLKERGDLSHQEQVREVYESKGWTRAVIKEAQYYKPGDVVRFGRDYKVIDASKGEYARVVETSRGTVTLEKADGSRLRWEPRKHNHVEVYDAGRLPIAVGDMIRSTRSDGEFKNGEVARVESVSGAQATISLKQGKETTRHELDLDKNKHWDHAYASTVHAAQGSTQYRVLFHIRAPETTNEHQQAREIQRMARVFGDRSFYVGATRASDQLGIYTNDKALAARAVAGRQDKTSAAQTMERGQEMAR